MFQIDADFGINDGLYGPNDDAFHDDEKLLGFPSAKLEISGSVSVS